jgi:hypothetical protein
MLIHDFHSKLVSGSEEGKLFEILRKLRKMEDLRGLLATDSDRQPEAGAWSVWTEESSPGATVPAKA